MSEIVVKLNTEELLEAVNEWVEKHYREVVDLGDIPTPYIPAGWAKDLEDGEASVYVKVITRN